MKKLLVLLILVFVVVGTGQLQRIFHLNNTPSGTPSESETGKYIFFRDIRDGWVTLENTKYRYEVRVPDSDQGYRFARAVSFMYHSANTKNPYTGSIAIDIVGFPDGPPERYVRSLYTSGQNIHVEHMPGMDVLKTDILQDGSGNWYQTIFFLHPDGLLISVRFESSEVEQFRTSYDAVIGSFRFTGVRDREPESLRLSGTVSKTSGNCMPSIGARSSCRTTPYRTTVYAYPETRTFSAGSANRLSDSDAVAQTRTDWFGHYSLELPSGSYSIFADFDGEKTCQSGDGFGFACKVVLYDTPEEMDIRLSNAAF